MIADLRPYPVTRESGVPWLGRIPGHWKMRNLRRILRRRAERGRPDLPLLSVVREKGVVRRDTADARENHNFIPDDLSRYQVVRAGQFAVNKMKAWQGSYGISCHEGIVSPAYFVFSVVDVDSKFFDHSIRSKAYVPFFTQASDGVRIGQWDLSPTRLREIPFAVPPVAEQTAIAHFLDRTNRRIQRALTAKEKRIALLEEQKQGVIHRAITGQVDVRTGKPYPTYKDHGVAELRRVPGHWKIVRLGKLIALQTGFPFKSEGFTRNAEDPRLLRGVNIAPGQLRWDDTVRWPATEAATPPLCNYRLQTGDIVLGMDRPVIQAGTRVAVVTEADVPSLLLQRVARIRPGPKLRRHFALLLLSGRPFANYMAPSFTGISVPHLSPEQIRGFTVALPGLSEQDQILESLAPQIGALQRAADRTARQIEFMREFRARLIADVVTGQLDVREAAATLPDARPA